MNKIKKITFCFLLLVCFLIVFIFLYPKKKLQEIAEQGKITIQENKDDAYITPPDEEWIAADKEIEHNPLYAISFQDDYDQLSKEEFFTLKGHLTKAESLLIFFKEQNMSVTNVIVRENGTYKFKNNSYFILDIPEYPDFCIHGVFYGIAEYFSFQLVEVDSVFVIPHSKITLGGI